MTAYVALQFVRGRTGQHGGRDLLRRAPARACDEAAANITDERLALGKREIYVHYPSGQGRSKLNLRARTLGTARNMNTVAKLAELAREME